MIKLGRQVKPFTSSFIYLHDVSVCIQGAISYLDFNFVIVARFPDRPFLKVFFLGFSKEVTEVTEILVDIEVL